ncbi:60S ribosomal protein L10 [Capsicum annuum]|nr:60S ribosomal protein L10 [Capsicum annuum]
MKSPASLSLSSSLLMDYQAVMLELCTLIRVHPFHVLQINKVLSCAGTDRLQTGMREAFGKPQGACACVVIGQVLLSVRCKDGISNHAQEALRRAKFKFPGCQKIIVRPSLPVPLWGRSAVFDRSPITIQGFTKFSRTDYLKYKSENRIVPDGFNAKLCSILYLPF